MAPYFEKRLIFVPSWVGVQLQREKQSLSALTNVSKSLDYLSGEDLAVVDYINKNAKTLFGFDNSDLGAVDVCTSSPNESYSKQSIEKYLYHVAPLLGVVEQTVTDRLFAPAASDVPAGYNLVAASDRDKGYQIFVSDVNTIFVTVWPGFFTADNIKIREDLNMALMNTIHTCFGYDVLSNLACFARYVEGMSNVLTTA